VRDGRLRRRGEPLAQRAALVGLDVAEGDPAQAAYLHHPGDSLGDGREQRPLAAVEEQRLLGIDEELVEGEAVRPHRGQKGGEPIDPVRDLVDASLHARDHTPGPSAELIRP
jgi:hypothetical protein